MFLIQAGGLGIMTLSTLIILLAGGRGEDRRPTVIPTANFKVEPDHFLILLGPVKALDKLKRL